jgi:hypothetical protein
MTEEPSFIPAPSTTWRQFGDLVEVAIPAGLFEGDLVVLGTAEGAYELVDGEWRPLPTDLGD